ncbi:MAG: hypothetical protein VB081_03890 [Christensenella sp.]|uniref:HAAS signaling domain-containing protein n=1 Tax=Christensenella sp. TaxID=1935934 RepID=UPI002B1FA17E|nr:hypothetical protein [Christensenella sp.]MEA5002619.1 hypothetical protein [Christensenella sp.]
MTTQEMIERYIYDVTRRLPSEQREDISRELNGLIDDMMEEREANGKTTQENAEDVLKELGAPFALAEKYRDKKQYLIGPGYYEQYWFVLKIVLIAVTVGMVIASIVQGAAWMIDMPGATQAQLITNTAASVGEAFANVVMGLIQGFAWVTIFFVIIERCSVKVNIKEAVSDAWKPQDLEDKPIPAEKAIIKKGDSIAGIVFTVAVIILFNFVPYLMGIWLAGTDGVMHFIPIFNLQTLAMVLPLFNICFVLGIIREVLRVATGRHTLWLGVATTLLNIAALIIACSIFFNPSIWNMDAINQAALIQPDVFGGALAQINAFFGYFTRFFGFILVFAFGLDSAISLYKGIRYGRA